MLNFLKSMFRTTFNVKPTIGSEWTLFGDAHDPFLHPNDIYRVEEYLNGHVRYSFPSVITDRRLSLSISLSRWNFVMVPYARRPN